MSTTHPCLLLQPIASAYAVGRRHHEGIPSIAVSPVNGRLWATWYASNTGCEDANNYVVLFTSADGGETWREVAVYDPDPGGPVRAFDPELWIAPDGLLRWTWTERTCPQDAAGDYAGCQADPSSDRLMMAVLSAEDEPAAAGGAGGASPRPFARQIARGVMMCKPTVLVDGAWLFPVAHWGEAPSASVYATTDGGRTFEERGGVTLPQERRVFDEHQIVELHDGILRAYIRTKGDTDGLWEAESPDGGRTWGEPRPCVLPHVSSRVFVRRLASGKLLLVKNGAPGDTPTERRDMTAYLSDDDGKTWPHALVLDAGRAQVSYPDGQQLPDGRIVVTYDYDRVGSRQILFATFREEDVVAGFFKTPGSRSRQTIHCGNPKVLLLRRAVDGPVELPLFDEKAWAFKKGYAPLGIRADECTVKGAMVPELLSVTTLSGRSLVPGRDFRVDPEWGVVGLTPEAPREPVRLSYAYTVLRIDSIVEKDGQRIRRYGEPHVANPVPPTLSDGERRVENLLISANGEKHFPILADAADAPRTAPNAEAAIPRTLAKLRCGEPVTILAWGDSVTAATYLPEEERWQSQFVRRLREAFPKSEITLVTRGWGGRSIRSFLDAPSGDEHNFAEAVLSVRPDLVVSEFVNDAGFPPETAQELYGRVLDDFRASGIEWAILTPHYVRCDWMGLKGQTDCDDDPRPYTAFVRRFARENGVGLADAALRWGHLWREGIPHETLLRNAINHPNTLGMSFYADALMDFFGI